MSMDKLKSMASESNSLSDIEARFTDFCKNGLSMDERSMKGAMKLFNESKHLLQTNTSATIGTGTPEEAERYWFVFVLYSVRRLSESNSDNSNSVTGEKGITFCQILRVAKLNLVDFFKEIPQFIVKAGPILCNIYGSDWEKKLEAKELQANFVHMSLLSRHYKRAFHELFSVKDTNIDKQSVVSDVSDYFRFGWLLFLALRVHAFSRFKDLVTCSNGLVSILAILIIHVPICCRKFTTNDPSRFIKIGEKGVDLIASLCKMFETSEDELRKTMEKTNKVIESILKIKPCLASECKIDLYDISTDGLIYYDGLLEETALSANLSILEKDYEDAILNKIELDERVFLEEEDSLLGSSSLSGGAINIIGTKRKFDSIASPTKTITSPLSPYRSPAKSLVTGNLGTGNSRIAATPVSTAMTTAKWLRDVICPLPSKPSAELESFLSKCDRNISTDVVRRAHVILEAIFPSSGLGDCNVTGSLQSTNLMDNIWAEQRKLEAVKLYYRVLQAMCTAEAQILNANNLTSLLTNEKFHRCMLACSAELVLATHKTVTMLFPVVLERTGVTAFDLSKVIESFIRHEVSLPRELKRHLNSLEERLLECLVWEKGSSLYNSLTVARPALSSEISRLGLLAEPMPSLDAIAIHVNMSSGVLPPLTPLQKQESSPGQSGYIRSPKRVCTENRSVLVERNSFTSPVKDRLLATDNLKSKSLPPALQLAFSSPTRPNPGGGGETCAETTINVFFGKIMKLAAVRINSMIDRLQLSKHIKENVYCLFQKILLQQSAIFFSRNIDQIILSCLYGVAKISQLNLTFKEIIFNYRKQPQCKPQVFRSVFVDWSAARRNGKTGKDHVDIITFYNEIFIPAVKPLLMELAPTGTVKKSDQISEASNNSDKGQCPGSPKVSKFPSLPDMSPKKVSAVHNVYVSPLRSSKMDALNSHSSKSYYACVGESTRAYQSPSKDLTAINSHLNGPKKLRGMLKFDDVGIVSDSLVSQSFHQQNGSSASLSGIPVKKEPDV
ncbi:retinoblastoma-related protein-like [Apium graveolens]|uniref:retinoblastoma-related protein-like n=1 Tax=Apium graveolens TaxID=4045 RepID=UPI003D7BBEFD